MLCPQVVALQHPWGEKIPVFWKIPGIGTKIRNFLDFHFILWHLMIHQMGSIHHKRATPSAADPWRFRSAWNSVHQLTLVQVCNSSLWLAFLSFHHGNKSSNMYLIINLIFHLWLMTHTHHLPESTFFWVHRSWESLNHWIIVGLHTEAQAVDINPARFRPFQGVPHRNTIPLKDGPGRRPAAASAEPTRNYSSKFKPPKRWLPHTETPCHRRTDLAFRLRLPLPSAAFWTDTSN